MTYFKPYNLLAILAFLAFTLFSLSSCKTIDSHGQYVEDSAIQQLENKRLTKEEVINLIGTPTVVPDYMPDTWYYIQRSLARRAWFTPKVEEQRIVKIKFSPKDTVQEVLVMNELTGEDVKVISEYTETYGTEQTGIQKFIRNIGRFNKTTDGKHARPKSKN